MGLAFQLKGLVTLRTEEIHDPRTGLGRAKGVRATGGAIEVLGDPSLRDHPRGLRPTCITRCQRGVQGEAHRSPHAGTRIYAFRPVLMVGSRLQVCPSRHNTLDLDISGLERGGYAGCTTRLVYLAERPRHVRYPWHVTTLR